MHFEEIWTYLISQVRFFTWAQRWSIAREAVAMRPATTITATRKTWLWSLNMVSTPIGRNFGRKAVSVFNTYVRGFCPVCFCVGNSAVGFVFWKWPAANGWISWNSSVFTGTGTLREFWTLISKQLLSSLQMPRLQVLHVQNFWIPHRSPSARFSISWTRVYPLDKSGRMYMNEKLGASYPGWILIVLTVDVNGKTRMNCEPDADVLCTIEVEHRSVFGLSWSRLDLQILWMWQKYTKNQYFSLRDNVVISRIKDVSGICCIFYVRKGVQFYKPLGDQGASLEADTFEVLRKYHSWWMLIDNWLISVSHLSSAACPPGYSHAVNLRYGSMFLWIWASNIIQTVRSFCNHGIRCRNWLPPGWPWLLAKQKLKHDIRKRSSQLNYWPQLWWCHAGIMLRDVQTSQFAPSFRWT